MAKLNERVDFTNHTIYAGIDVHLKSWNVSLYCDQQYLKSFTQPPEVCALQKFLNNNYPGANYKCAYEAGFSGFQLQRQLKQIGIDCIVVNAADVPQTDKASKTKTDANDSRRIARALQSGLLDSIYIPEEYIDGDRQLVRCNFRLNNDLTRAKNRVKGILYQLGVNIPDRFIQSGWSKVFIKWIKDLQLNNPSSKLALFHQLHLVEAIRDQKLAVLKDIRQLIKLDRYSSIAKHLLTVPGIGPIGVACIVTEIVDINRFNNFAQLNSFVGFYPSQFSSGEKVHQGKIISRQQKRLRALFIEGAWIAIRTDPALTKAYLDWKIKVGPKRAIIKIARRLLSRVRFVWLKQINYEKGIIK